jgi:serine/threonine-protein kinase
MKIRLSVTTGPAAGKEFTFDGRDSFLVGRAKDAHFRLPDDDQFISRRHFLLDINAPRCRLHDLNSRNGTEVNGTKVDTCELKGGDEIRAGITTFRVDVVPAETPADGVRETRQYAETPAASALPPSEVARVESLVQIYKFRMEAGEPPAVEDLCPPDAPHLLEPLRQAVARLEVKPARGRSVGPRVPAVPGYLLTDRIGRGGMGVVYKAVRTSDGLPAAVKVIVPAVAGCNRHIDRIVREAKILGQLRHPNVVRLLDAGELDGALYIAMELVNGPDAEKVIKGHGPQPVERAVRLIRQALAGIAHAHASGYVHRDIKPSNLLLARENGTRVVKVADFGLARAFEQSRISGLTLYGEVGGTPAFMPPEQVTHYREVTPAADQYAAAATLYYLLAGRPAFDLPPDPNGKLVALLTNRPIPIRILKPEVPEELARVIHQAMAKDPAERFPDVAAFRAALKPFSNPEG